MLTVLGVVNLELMFIEYNIEYPDGGDGSLEISFNREKFVSSLPEVLFLTERVPLLTLSVNEVANGVTVLFNIVDVLVVDVVDVVEDVDIVVDWLDSHAGYGLHGRPPPPPPPPPPLEIVEVDKVDVDDIVLTIISPELTEFTDVLVVALSITRTFASNGELDVHNEFDCNVNVFVVVIMFATITLDTALNTRKL